MGSNSPGMSAYAPDSDPSSTALNAPNALVTFSASISMAARRRGLGGFGFCGFGPGGPRWPALEQRQESAWQETGDDHDDGAIDHEGEAGAAATQVAVGEFLERYQDQRADQWAEELAGAAQRRHHNHLHGDQDAEARFGIDEAEHAEIERAGQGGEGAAQHVGVELVAAGRDAERARGAFGVLDGAQIEAHAAALHPPGEREQEGQHAEEDVIE